MQESLQKIGYIKKGLNEDTENKKKEYCLFCNKIKPERCHHCSRCEKCVLVMDHHCIWLNNCIGFKNKKFFMLLIIYTFLLCFVSLGFSVYPIVVFFWEVDNGRIEVLWNLIVFCIGYFFLIIFGFLMGYFLRYHLELVRINKTNLERMDEIRGNILNYHYDLGKEFNWKFVFGKKKFLWYFPVDGEVLGDGIVFLKKLKYKNNNNVFESYLSSKQEYYEESQIENFVKNKNSKNKLNLKNIQNS